MACLSLINTEKERSIGIGDSYNFPPLLYGECNVNSDFQTYFKV